MTKPGRPIPEALTKISLDELELVLARLHRGELVCPVTHSTLVVAGLPHLVDRLTHLQGLDARAVQAVLVAVIAERRRAAR